LMSDQHRMRLPTSEFYMKTAREMTELFKDCPDAIRATHDIAEACDFELQLGGEIHFPSFDVPEGQDQRRYLIALGREGVRTRYGVSDPDKPSNDWERKVMNRFHHELDIIEKTKYINYYLVVWDFVSFARRQHIPVGLRGSGGASLLAYAIGITDIEPLTYSLVF
jgi:DNA polymerase-3 subunit alpha